MFRNYWLTSLRNLVRHKAYSITNIVGLTIGLTFSILIFSYIVHESGFDNFHKNAKRLAWVQAAFKSDGDTVYSQLTSYATGPILKLNNKTIASYVRTAALFGDVKIKRDLPGYKQITENKILFADSNYFNTFSFPLVQGQPAEVLLNPFSIVLTRQTAEKYFGNADPVGQLLLLNNQHVFKITGVADNLPSNSSIDFNFICSLSSLATLSPDRIKYESSALQAGSFITYLLLNSPADLPALNEHLQQFSRVDNNGSQQYRVVPIANTHLNPTVVGTAKQRYLHIFLLIAIILLLMAISNYVNMATARAVSRSREIGVRKVFGADALTVAKQFLVESSMYSVCSFLLAYLVAMLLQAPLFTLLNLQHNVNFLFQPLMLLVAICLLLATIILSSVYPSFVLSRFRPSTILSNHDSPNSRSTRVRQALVVFQFSISIVLIVASLIIGQQMNFIKTFDAGIKTNNTMVIPFGANIGRHYTAFEHDLEDTRLFSHISSARYPLYQSYDTYFVPARNSDRQVSLNVLPVDTSFIQMMGLQWKIAPLTSYSWASPNAILLNQAAFDQLHLKPDAIGQSLQLGSRNVVITGVLKDFNYQSLRSHVDPLALTIVPHTDSLSVWSTEGGFIFVSLKTKVPLSQSLSQLTQLFARYDAENAFEYHLIEEQLAQVYENEIRLEKLSSVALIITIIIACFGLYGLSIFILQRKNREIAIRKIMGAEVWQLFFSITADFLKIVVIASVLAIPIGWWLLNNWLEAFPYRISIHFWIFLTAALGAMLIAVLTTSMQILKVTNTNPARTLKSE